MFYSIPSCFIPTDSINFICDHGHLYRKRIFESFLGFLPLPRSDYNKFLVNFLIVNPIVGLLELFIAKYIKKNQQKIFKTVLKTPAPFSDGSCEKFLKARLLDVYCNKFHIKCYNFCQQCEDYLTIARAKSPNRVFFAIFFSSNHINFCWQ